MAYSDYKDLSTRATSYKILCNKSFATASNRQYDEHQGGLLCGVLMRGADQAE